MNNIFVLGKWMLVATAALFALGAQAALASNEPLVSGSYQVLKSKDLDPQSHIQSNRQPQIQSHIQLRIHLVNHGPSDLAIERVTLWDFSHADKGGTSACTLALHANASADTTLQFTIRRSDYELWRRGFRPRLVLEMAGPGRTKNKTVVRLDRTPGQEAK